MSSTRRMFLQQLGAAGLISLGARPPGFLSDALRAADGASRPDADGRILVIVELAGGNDGLNTVVPHGDDAYYKARPALSVPQNAVLRIDDYVGLHPQLAGLKELYDEGRLAILQGIGYENPDRSHFRSMDIWHSARPEVEYTQDGWIGRALDSTLARHAGRVPALAVGAERLPLAMLSGKINVPAIRTLDGYRLQVGDGPADNRVFQRRLLGELADLSAPAGSELEFLRKTALAAYSSAERLEKLDSSYKPVAEYPQNGLGRTLETVARIIAGDFGTQIYFVSLGGFDTHSQQQAGHEALLAELSSAIRAFYSDLHSHGLDERVLLATFSEFGRRVAENGSLGTDHGAASQMFVVTAAGKGGLYGRHPSLTELTEGDLKHHTDFRSVYATLLEGWLGIPSEPVLGKPFEMLPFV